MADPNQFSKFGHLLSCSIDSRPNKDGFFVREGFDVDGLPLRYPMPCPSDEEREALRLAALKAQKPRSGNRLVKAAKCPTPVEDGEMAGILGPDTCIHFSDGRIDLETGEIIKERPVLHNTKAIIEHKAWCDEYRIRTKTETPVTSLPPENTGERKTENLSLSGAKKIAESCRFVAKDRGGYSTFLTLTLDEAARERVAEGATVQKEISRFFDALKKMWSRGWVEEFTHERKRKGRTYHETITHRGEAHGDAPFDYCWVVENPKNEAGEDNPHAHILMRWRVPFRDFPAWAQRIERLWGQGFAHLEKIKEPEKAGAYMAKAAGYMTKATDSDQGEVRGNRYGISKAARAPDWEIVGVHDAGIMGSLIADVHDYFQWEYGGHIRRREFLKKKLEETPKEEAKERKKIGEALEKVRSVLNDEKKIPLRPSKYQLVLCGTNAARAFFNWAKDKSCGLFANWLPRKELGVFWDEEKAPEGQYLREFRKRIWCGRANRIKGACERYWSWAFSEPEPEGLDENVTFEDFVMA